MKKILSIFLTVVLLMCIMPTSIFNITANAATSGYYTYTVSNNEATITKVSTAISGDITIPDTLGGHSVTAIGEEAFSNNTKITSVIMSDCIISIGDFAFANCTSLKNVSISKNANNIGYAAFGNTAITELIIPDSVTRIEEYAFDGSKLKSITIGKGVINIGQNAFYRCNLEFVNITDIASWCNINFEKETSNPLYYANNLYLDGQLIDHLIIPNDVVSIGDWAFYRCSSLTSITIPDSVTSIGKYAFYDTSYYNNPSNWENKALYIGNCLIKYDVFSSNTLYKIKEGTKTIASEAFNYCDRLQNIIIPNSVENICERAFFACRSLTSIELPRSITNVAAGTFSNCSGLVNISIPDSVTDIGGEAFNYCTSLKSISIAENLTNIDYAFSGCSKLENVFYRGDLENKNIINIDNRNSYLINANWYYNSCIYSAEHFYDNGCDFGCNVCGYEREALGHDFTNGLCTNCNRKLGDINDDNIVDILDLVSVARIANGFGESSDFADIDLNNTVDYFDTTAIRKLLLNKF